MTTGAITLKYPAGFPSYVGDVEVEKDPSGLTQYPREKSLFGSRFVPPTLHRDLNAVNSHALLKVIRIPGAEDEARTAVMELGGLEKARSFYQGMVDEFIREIRVMHGLKGITNIVSVEDYALVADPVALGFTIFIRMELLTSFREYQQHHTLSEDEVLRLGIDLCTALSFCEKAGILHRDIKPENIMVSAMGSFKLGDFGVARRLDQTGSHFSFKGTFPYMAPELVKGQPYDRRADLYSLGLVLYRLLNRNREPFLDAKKQMVTQQDRELAASRRLSGEALPPPVEASPGFAAAILKACAFQVKDRYQDAAAFRQALEALQKSPFRRAYTRGRRPGRKYALLLAALLGLGLFFGLTSQGRGIAASLATRVKQAFVKPAPTPGPVITVKPDAGALRVAFILNQARSWAEAEPVLEALRAQGLVLGEADTAYFLRRFPAQFVFEGKSQGLVKGDSVSLSYQPDAEFAGFLAGKGFALEFESLTRRYEGN